MTDRIHSCKDSPDGKHAPAMWGGLTHASCKYCGRRIPEARAPSDAKIVVRHDTTHTFHGGEQ